METHLEFGLKEFCDRSGIDCGMIVSVNHRFGAYTLCMAGGAVRRTLINMKLDSDFDFFFANETNFENWCAVVEGLGFKKTSETENQVTYEGSHRYDEKSHNIKLQGVKIGYYFDIVDLFEQFDFTITQFAIKTSSYLIDLETGEATMDDYKLYTTDMALWDLARRKLVVNNITYPVASTRRMLKYMQQGFTACGGTITDLLKQTIENPDRVDLDVKYVD